MNQHLQKFNEKVLEIKVYKKEQVIDSASDCLDLLLYILQRPLNRPSLCVPEEAGVHQNQGAAQGLSKARLVAHLQEQDHHL